MFEERPRKVHFHHDQQGATFGLKKTPFANTLCKMNSAVPESHITTDPDKVTCKICRKDQRFKVAANSQFGRFSNVNRDYGKMAYPEAMYVQQFGRAVRPHMVNGHNARYRRNWRGQLILQIEVHGDERLVAGRWRDATLADLGGGVV